MRLLDLVEQHHRVGLTAHSLSQLTTLIVADISRRRPNQTRHGVTLLILAHIDSRHQILVIEQELRQRLRQPGLAHARRTEEDERTNRAATIAQSRARTAHSVRNHLDGLVLTHHAAVQLLLHIEQFLALACQHSRHGHSRPLRHHLGNILSINLLLDHRAICAGHFELLLQGVDLLLRLANLTVANLRHTTIVATALSLRRLDLQSLDRLLIRLDLLQQIALALPLGSQCIALSIKFFQLVREFLNTVLISLATNRLALDLDLARTTIEGVDLLRHRIHFEAQTCRRLINQVNRLVGQKTRRDVTVRELDRRHNSLVLDAHLVMILVALLQSAQDRNGILNGRLIDHNLLKTTLQGLILLEIFLEFVECRSADCAQLATRQCRLQDVGSIHRAVALTRTNQRVNLVDEEQYLSVRGDHLLHHSLQSLLELALVLRTRNQRTHIEREDTLRAQIFGHVAIDNAVCNTLRNSGFTHARLADQNRIVLGSARENLQHAADLLVAANHGVELASTRLLVKVDSILTQRIELLRRGGRIDLRALAELGDGRLQILLGCARLLQKALSLTALGNQAKQQVLNRGILVAKGRGEVDRTLHHQRRLVRKILLARSARHLRQRGHGTLNILAQELDIDPDTSQQKRPERILLGDERCEQVQRIESLLTAALRKCKGLLQSLLRLDCK